MERAFDVYGVGHALVDIQYKVETDFLAARGIEKGVMTLIDEERLRALTRALPGRPLASASGGSAANTMIGVARFGGRAYYACLTGRDAWGDFYQRDLEEAGVATAAANRGEGTTGQCIVLITPDADRTLNTYLGIGRAIGPQHLEADKIAASRYLYLEGYLLSSDNGFAACCRARQLARQHRTAVALTLSDPFVVSTFKERFEALVEGGVDLLFCNEEEARAFSGQSERRAAALALGHCAALAYITCGADGALICANGRLAAVPALAVEAIDTTGAGDLFAGGVLYGLTHGFALEEAGRLGSYAAARVVAQYGPRLLEALPEAGDILARFPSAHSA